MFYVYDFFFFFFFKQKTAYEILTCDWSSDVCSSDLGFFLKYSKCIWGLNKVNNSHNCHGLKRVGQDRVSNGVERVPF